MLLNFGDEAKWLCVHIYIGINIYIYEVEAKLHIVLWSK